jgi:glutaredoxin
MASIRVYTLDGCRHCTDAKDYLTSLYFHFEEVYLHRIDDKEAINLLEKETGSRKFPQIFLKGKYIGCSMDLQKLSAHEITKRIEECYDDAVMESTTLVLDEDF